MRESNVCCSWNIMYLISCQFDLNHGSWGIDLEALVEVLQSLGLVFRYAMNILEEILIVMEHDQKNESWGSKQVYQ